MAAFQVSPGVNVSEIDLTTVVPAVGTSTGAFVGTFRWGPANEIVQVSSEARLADVFGKPKSSNYLSFFSAANFLSYGNDLRVVRAIHNEVANTGNTALTATSNAATTIVIDNDVTYTSTYKDAYDANTAIAARYPGALGNSLKVSAFSSSNTVAFAAWQYSSLFDSVPGTSPYIEARYPARTTAANDEVHIVVVDEEGDFTGVPGTVLEKFAFISKATDAKSEDGRSIYYRDVLFNSSRYVNMIGKIASDWDTVSSNTVIYTNTGEYNFSLTGGADGVVRDADVISGWDKFADSESVDVSLLVTGAASQAVQAYVVQNVAETRKDAVAFLSPSLSATLNASNPTSAIIAEKTALNLSSSYAVYDSGWKYQYDKYNDTFRWVPLNPDIAGLCVRTDRERDPWFSPAGLNRGQIKNVTKLGYNPIKANRDSIYKVGINPVVSFPGEGTYLYGDKTLLAKPSAFDRINVRRLFITLEKAIARAAKFSLFEFNDEFSRAQFVSLVEPFLREVHGRRGIFDYRVICDESNNTPEIIDRNEFVGDIYIKPARSINFIQLNFVAVRTGVAFEEIVGQF